ncbi:MAG: hypothetical protein ABWY53_02565 [Leifsonia flava]
MGNRFRYGGATLTVLAALTLLSGCATAAAAPSPTPSPTASQTDVAAPTASPTPSPSPDAVDPANPGTWIVSSSGVGPVVLGDDLATAAAALAHFTERPASDCPNPRLKVYSFDGAPTVTLVLDEAGVTVTGLRLTDRDLAAGSDVPHTREGIGTGSTIDEAMAVYPDMVVDAGSGMTNYSLPSDSGGWVSFSSGEFDTQDTVRVVDVYPGGPLFYELCAG